jgi:hypothetical protein
LRERVTAYPGLTGRRLWRELRERGYAGGYKVGCEPADIGKTIHPHPTLGESIGMAAEVFEGHCTDLPPQKKK